MRHPRFTVRRSALPAGLGVLAALLLVSAPALARPSSDAALAAFERAVPYAGVAWGVSGGGQLLVTVDASVRGAKLARVEAAAARLGARVDVAAGTFRTDAAVIGGDAIYGSRYRCSLGFNVRSGSTYSFLTAGHCGKPEPTWWDSSSHGTLLGSTVSATFPGKDYAIVRYAAGYAVDTVGRAGSIDVVGSRNAQVGETLWRDGSTTGEHSGQVQALNVTVRYQGGGTVRGLIQTNICAEPGDSGGSLYSKADNKAIGLTSGGSGDCRRGGTTFFQPVVAALNAFGVAVY